MCKDDKLNEHISIRMKSVRVLMESYNVDNFIVYSGESNFYFLDDQTYPFKVNPHFAHWCSLEIPSCFILVDESSKPKLFILQTKDFWHDTVDIDTVGFERYFEVSFFDSEDKMKTYFESLGHSLFIGETKLNLENKKIDFNPKEAIAFLDWHRALKSNYEVAQVITANQRAAQAHQQAKQIFSQGGTEYDIHISYLKELGDSDHQLPYNSIVACDHKSAILHYQNKRHAKAKSVLLIDAGAKSNGYCSDITRTYVKSGSTHPVFISILKAMEHMHNNLCQSVRSGVSFSDLNLMTHKNISKILIDHEILRGLTEEEVLIHSISSVFFPHGLGHMLGIQVHDVGGQQKNEKGDLPDRDGRFPFLRLRRSLRSGEIITVEPGLYFIPVLLDKFRSKNSENYKFFNWELIDKLVPFGGIRIEDNLLVEESGHKNLTRPYLDNKFIVE
ncbi:MAG: Xaa-Pro dipeptidase [Zetaproteobacteria bacterium]|nr:Xaa-Pro dipeptidase [Pseudobdellovibrionaceae bacterium]